MENKSDISVIVLVKLELTYNRKKPKVFFCSEGVIQKRSLQSFTLCLMKMSDLTLIDRGDHGKVLQSSSLR